LGIVPLWKLIDITLEGGTTELKRGKQKKYFLIDYFGGVKTGKQKRKTCILWNAE